MNWKRTKTVFLAAILAANAAIPAFAVKDEAPVSTAPKTYQVSYSQVAQMVLDNNLQVTNNEITMDGLTGDDEIKKQYKKLYDTISATSAGLTSVINSSADTNVKTVATATQASLSILKTLFESQQDTTEDMLDLTELQIDQANNQLIQAAQSMFSVYYQLENNVQQLKYNRSALEDALKAAQVQYQLGTGTALAVSEAEASLASLKTNITDLQNQTINIKYQMNQLLGHQYNDQIVFGKMPEPDLDYVKKINLSTDITDAQTNSYIVRIKKLQRSILDDDVKDEKKQRKIKSNEIDMELQKIGASLEKQHYTIQNQQAVLAAEQKKLENAQLKWNQAEKQYQLGVISSMQLNQIKNSFLNQQTTVETTKATLFWNIESYRWILNGLSAS